MSSLADFVSLEDLYVAYRKAKTDMFFERDHYTALDLCTFENSLDQNLKSLHARLIVEDPDWQNDIGFVGSYTYIPKKLEAHRPSDQFIQSDPDIALEGIDDEKPVAKFRLIGIHPVEFHIVSALWLLKVGEYLDRLLSSAAYGSRLKRGANAQITLPVASSSVGSFRPYVYGFKQWRERGIAAMQKELADGHHIVAITADLRSFYHEVDPSYLLHPDFLKRHEGKLSLSEQQRKFTELLIQAMKTWATSTPDHAARPGRGIPIGLSASRVIANVILEEFDQFVMRELSPVYYGRYVDDIFLVLGNWTKPKSPEEVWKVLIARSDGLLVEAEDTSQGYNEPAYCYRPTYAGTSELRFAGEKQKVFSLTGSKGLSLLNSINSAIAERSSDWRLLPDLEEDEEAIISDVIAAGKDITEEVDNLRKSDGVSVKRLAFAIRLRNFEAVERHLLPNQWRKHRDKFFNLALDHIVTASGLFSFAPYIPRLFGLAVACNDWRHAFAIVKGLNRAHTELQVGTKFAAIELSGCQAYFFRGIVETLCKSLDPSDRNIGQVDGILKLVRDTLVVDVFSLFKEHAGFGFVPPNALACMEVTKGLFASDLARIPWREAYLESKLGALHGALAVEIEGPLPDALDSILHYDDLKELVIALGRDGEIRLPLGLAFPTRPLSLADITQIEPGCLLDTNKLRKWLRATRGSDFPENSGNPPAIKNGVLNVYRAAAVGNPTVAVPCFLTKDQSWTACVSQNEDPDAKRYFRLNRLVNQVLTGDVRANYLILPECSLPRTWFDWLAQRLAKSGVSLIAGLEYAHWQDSAGSSFVSNEVRASLVTDFLGYTEHVVHTQEKAAAAFNEEKQLFQVAGLKLKPRRALSKLPICHGGMYFGVLICSELTNIAYRQEFLGKVDALFVPEWNPDIDTFSPIVESSALDIHCYVVQANNRLYGDCRIRAPYRTGHMRDIARIRGGEADYFVVAKLDVQALRAFQSNFRSPPDGPFKPVPDGFVIDPKRKALPAP